MNLSSKQLAAMAALITLNVAIGGIVHLTKLPIFLDAVGTLLAVILIGLMPGVVVGVVSFIIAAVILNPVYIWFIGTQAVLALVAYVLAARLGAFASIGRVVLTGLLLGVVAGIVSAPVIVLVFHGVAGSGRDLITADLISTGQQVYKAVLVSGAASEPVDKLLQALAVYFVLKSLPKRVLAQFRNPVLERNGFL